MAHPFLLWWPSFKAVLILQNFCFDLFFNVLYLVINSQTSIKSLHLLMKWLWVILATTTTTTTEKVTVLLKELSLLQWHGTNTWYFCLLHHRCDSIFVEGFQCWKLNLIPFYVRALSFLFTLCQNRPCIPNILAIRILIFPRKALAIFTYSTTVKFLKTNKSNQTSFQWIEKKTSTNYDLSLSSRTHFIKTQTYISLAWLMLKTLLLWC